MHVEAATNKTAIILPKFNAHVATAATPRFQNAILLLAMPASYPGESGGGNGGMTTALMDAFPVASRWGRIGE